MDVEIKGRVLKSDEFQRNHIAVDNSSVDAVYETNLNFWTTRNSDELTPDVEAKILTHQTHGDTPYNRGTRKKLFEIIREAEADDNGDGRFSMLELGAANGTVLERIKDEMPSLDYDYYGYECLPLFVDDFRKRFPDKFMRVGAVEDFIAEDPDAFGRDKFSVFFASLVFVMIKPDLVRAALRKASELTDQFLFMEFVDDMNPDLQPNETFIYHMADATQLWFVHPWADYMAEIGFEIVDTSVAELTPEETASPDYNHKIQGTGYVHCRRLGSWG